MTRYLDNGRTPHDGTETAALPTGALVAQYAGLVNDELTTRHGVASPLGLWILLALSGPVTTGQHRTELESVLGTSVTDARARAEQLLASPDPTVACAVAAWARTADLLPTYASFATALPPQVEQGPIPSQAQADAWAAEHTRRLIEKFPIDITEDTLMVLASALVTDITWRDPLTEVPAADLGGGFAAQATLALKSTSGGIYATDAAGLVAVHRADSVDGLAVYSVIADPKVPAGLVHRAAHQVAHSHRSSVRTGARRLRLDELTLGEGHAWDLTETWEIRTVNRPGVVEDYTTLLPAWEASSDHDLLAVPGVLPVLASLTQFIKPEDLPAEVAAKQTAMARYDARGFQAAAVTAFGVMRGASIARKEKVPVRRATISFNRPHAVLAVAGNQYDAGAWSDLPAFSAWIESAT